MDIAFEIRVFYQGSGFVQDGCFAAARDDPAMMERDGTEMAAAIAAAVAVDGKTHFFDRRHATVGCIAGMGFAGKWQGKDLVQLFCGKGCLWWVLHQIPVTVALDKRFAIDRGLFAILKPERCSVKQFVLAYFIETWQENVGCVFRKWLCEQGFPVLA